MQNVRMTNRRRVLGTVVALLSLASLAVPAARAADSSGFRPAIVDVTGWSRLGAAPLLGGALAGPTLPGPSAGDGVGPGSYLLIDHTDGNSYICTANFVWASGGARYLGAAGHCFLPSNQQSSPLNDPGKFVTRVQVCVSASRVRWPARHRDPGDLR